MIKKELFQKMGAICVALAVVVSMNFGGTVVYADDDEVTVVEDTSTEDSTSEDTSSSEDTTVSDDTDSSEDGSEVTISQNKMKLSVGGSSELDVDGDYDSVTWSSSKPSVATVSTGGKVKAKKSGTATITAKVTCTVYNQDDAASSDEYDYFAEESTSDAETESDDGTAAGDTLDVDTAGEEVVYTLKCKVTVSKGAVLSCDKLTIKKGKSVKLKVTGAGKTKVKWGVKNKKIATVKNGKVKAIKVGSTVITAKVGKKTLKCKLKVKK